MAVVPASFPVFSHHAAPFINSGNIFQRQRLKTVVISLLSNADHGNPGRVLGSSQFILINNPSGQAADYNQHHADDEGLEDKETVFPVLTLGSSV